MLFRSVISTTQKAELWCASAEITLDSIGPPLTGPKLMLNLPLENVGVGHRSEQRAIDAVRGAVHYTVDSYRRGAGIPPTMPLGDDGIILRRHHLVEPEIDEIIAREKYDEKAIAAMSPEARAQLALEAKVLLDQARAAFEAACQSAGTANNPEAFLSHEVRVAQIRMRVAEGNVWIATKNYTLKAADPVQAPDKPAEVIKRPRWRFW